ncbi:uncharacterized protein UV8b_07520 [Ustilaginoidea virens]|uniref:Uncharacterized protein n=1 Tax=Ustilaginoidea virens TaxID=1159556 RepID=A0A8E5HY26_USTVR|nr:uncharacterized protein UV8b_07520 [Ustilaginoidea virens]QUC23279.1 hypothetical protein UV8b_07520 [Ustilaginoidea virens]
MLAFTVTVTVTSPSLHLHFTFTSSSLHLHSTSLSLSLHTTHEKHRHQRLYSSKSKNKAKPGSQSSTPGRTAVLAASNIQYIHRQTKKKGRKLQQVVSKDAERDAYLAVGFGKDWEERGNTTGSFTSVGGFKR